MPRTSVAEYNTQGVIIAAVGEEDLLSCLEPRTRSVMLLGWDPLSNISPKGRDLRAIPLQGRMHFNRLYTLPQRNLMALLVYQSAGHGHKCTGIMGVYFMAAVSCQLCRHRGRLCTT